MRIKLSKKQEFTVKKSHLYILLISLAFLLLIGGIVAFAVLPPKPTSNGLVFELSDDGKSYIVADMDNHFTRAVIVPAEHEGKPVTIIGAYAFQNCVRLESIDLPDTIKMIHSGAFKDCARLRAITLPDACESVGARAFYGCTGLLEVTLPSDVELQIGAFEGCRNIKSVTASADAISAIPSERLERVTINGGDHIHESAFMGYSSLCEITIPKSIKRIGNLAFNGCDNLKAVYIEDIAAWCAVDFGEADANPLRYAKKLYLKGALATDIVIPEGVTRVAPRAFDGCKSIKSLTLPDSLTEIGEGAFRATAISKITIGSAVESVGKFAFYGCSSLRDIYVGVSEIPNTWSAFWCEGTPATVHFADAA